MWLPLRVSSGGGIERVVNGTRARHMATASGACGIGDGFGIVYDTPSVQEASFLAGEPEAAGPKPVGHCRPRTARASYFCAYPGVRRTLPADTRSQTEPKDAFFFQTLFAGGVGHIDVVDSAIGKELAYADAAVPGQCSPCRYPAWAEREVAFALVASRIDLWFLAHVEHRSEALDEVGRWDIATFVTAKAVTKDPTYEKALADERAARERELNRPKVLPMFSLPILLGGAFRTRSNGSGFVVGTRPEMVVGAIHDRYGESRKGIGFGGYLGAVTMSGSVSRQTFLGGGGTLALYTGTYGLAVSGGVDVPTSRGSALPTIGGFIGFRGDHDQGYIDMPFGLRVDARLGSTDTRVVVITAQVDIPGMVGVVANAFSSMLHGSD